MALHLSSQNLAINGDGVIKVSSNFKWQGSLTDNVLRSTNSVCCPGGEQITVWQTVYSALQILIKWWCEIYPRQFHVIMLRPLLRQEGEVFFHVKLITWEHVLPLEWEKYLNKGFCHYCSDSVAVSFLLILVSRYFFCLNPEH